MTVNRPVGRLGDESMLLLPVSEQGKLLTQIHDLRPLSELQLGNDQRGVIQQVIDQSHHAKRLRALGLRPANRILLCGPPGSGKTSTAGGIAHALGIPLVSVRLDAIINRFVGSTAPQLRNAFEFAHGTPVVMLIDEFDALGMRRSGDLQAAAQEQIRIMSTLLVLFEEMRGSDSIVVAATNLHESLDPALWRRFDEIVVFRRPTTGEATAMIKAILARYGQNPILWRWPASLTCVSYADVERIALDAVKAVTMDSELPIDRALRSAVERQHARREITSRKGKR